MSMVWIDPMSKWKIGPVGSGRPKWAKRNDFGPFLFLCVCLCVCV